MRSRVIRSIMLTIKNIYGPNKPCLTVDLGGHLDRVPV